MVVEPALKVEVIDFAERWVDRWNAHDVGGVLGSSSGLTWQDPSIDGIASGQTEARRYIETVFHAFSDIAWTIGRSRHFSGGR